MAERPPSAAEVAAARVAASHDGQVLLAELARLTDGATGALVQASDADLRAHAGKCALMLHIRNMIKRGNPR